MIIQAAGRQKEVRANACSSCCPLTRARREIVRSDWRSLRSALVSWAWLNFRELRLVSVRHEHVHTRRHRDFAVGNGSKPMRRLGMFVMCCNKLPNQTKPNWRRSNVGIFNCRRCEVDRSEGRRVAESACLSCTWRASFHFVPFGFLVFRLCHISRDAWTCFLLTQSLTFCVTDDSRVVWINEMKFASLCSQRYFPPSYSLPPSARAMCLLFAICHLLVS